MLKVAMHYNEIRPENSFMTAKQVKRLIITIIPLLMAVLIMIPRLLSPQFGVMDDGLIYVEVQKILQGDFSMDYDIQAGRFRPLYWLYFTLIYLIAGPNPIWFFIGHLLILLILLIEIRALMKHYQARDWQILLTSLVFLFTIPIIENFYTLSKGDPLSLVFILASLVCFEKIKGTDQKTVRWIFALLAFLNGLFAIWAKETAYIMAPISAGWAAYIIFLQRKNFSQRKRQSYLIYFASMSASMAAFFLLRSVFGAPAVTDGSFTVRYSFTVGSLLERIPRWVTLYASYYHYLVPFVAMAAIILLLKRDIDPEQKLYFFQWGLWLLAWVGALLPWEYARAYYLLAFSLGASILIGLFAGHLGEMINHTHQALRWSTITLTVLTVVLFFASLTHYRTHAWVQLIFDRTNAQMLEITHEITPENGAVFVSLETRKEYVEGIEYFLVDFYGLSAIDYTHISVETLERLHWYSDGIVLMPYVSNLPRLVVRAGVDEEFTMLWNEIVVRNKGDRLIPITQVREDFRIINLNLPVIFCPIVGNKGFCENHDPFLDTRVFNYGWDIYTIR
jgi:hypothetical protein